MRFSKLRRVNWSWALNLALLILSVETNAIATTKTTCFQTDLSKQGATLYQIDPETTIRIEFSGGAYDIGLKMQNGISAEAQRLKVSPKAVGGIVGEEHRGQSSQSRPKVVVYMFYGQLIVATKSKVLIKDLSGETTVEICQKIGEKASLEVQRALAEMMKNSASATVSINSPESLANALGL